VNQAFGEGEAGESFLALIDHAVQALDSFGRTMNSVESLLNDDQLRGSLQQGLAELPETIRELRLTMSRAREALDGAGDLITGIEGAVASADRNFRNLEGFTGPLGESGPDMVNSMKSAVDGIDRLLEEIAVVTNSFATSDGSLKRLVDDPELYNNVNTLAQNANALMYRLNVLTHQLSPDLRKTVHDASIFTDKISREPGRVLSGALNRGPNVK
jgi:phospholipid/cholesterol/gamma-HCH transport system substrate-binding protein